MTEYMMGVEVTCTDGACGELRRVVIDPVARSLTHLVVEPGHGPGRARLVPIELVDEAAEGVTLRCSGVDFDALEEAEETHFLPDYGLGGGLGGAGMGGAGMAAYPQAIIEDRVPVGEVEVRRSERVHATDGDIGRVQGLVIDPKDHHVTHVLLQEGHLWGKKEVAIPISAVKEVAADGVQLELTKDQVRDLPPVELAGPG
jgi:sporulation protein YlmC with PRC-barrel domain